MSLHPLRQRWVSAAQSWVSVRESDSGQQRSGTLVFLHGRLSSSELWRPVQERLRMRFRCLMVDFPPQGSSLANHPLGFAQQHEIVSEVIDRLCGEPVVLVGHDTGGAVAQSLALADQRDARGRVAGLVLLNSGSISSDLAMLACGWPSWRLRRQLERLLDASPLLLPSDSAELRAAWSDTSELQRLRHSVGALQRSWHSFQAQSEWGPALSQLKIPVLMLWGGNDPLVAPERGFDLIRKISGASFYLRAESGHWPFLDSPEWVASRLREFVEQCAGLEGRFRPESRARAFRAG